METRGETKENLSSLVVRGGIMVTILKFIERILTMVRLVILARLLSPKDFGLMGIALLILTIFDTFSQTGLRQALIQKKDDIQGHLNSAWTILVVRSFFLLAIIVFAAPYAATFFKAPDATNIIRIVPIAIIFIAFTNIGIIYFQKELNFKKQVILELCAITADFTVAITLAFVLRNIWALVFGMLTGHATRMVVSYVMHPYRPRFDFNLTKAAELFRFGKWVVGSTIMVFLITQGDSLMVAKIAGVAALGFYQVAYRISNITATEITYIITQVTFPAYSKIQDNKERLREAYLKVLSIVCFVAIPLATAIIVFSRDFTIIFMKDKWLPMVPVLQILSIAGLFRALAATATPVFYAVGRPVWDTRLQFVRLIIMISLILPMLYAHGITGAAFAVTISIFIALLGFIYSIIQILACPFYSILRRILYPALSSILMVIVFVAIQSILGSINLFEFVLLVIICAITYLGAMLFWQYTASYCVMSILLDHIKQVLGKDIAPEERS